MRELLPHQVTALNTIRGQPRVALFMQMRLGKTPVIIRWAQDILTTHGPGRVLIVGPMDVLDDWVPELELSAIRRGDIVRLDGQTRTSREELVAGGTGWYLANFEAVRGTPDIYNAPWDIVIVDESTRIRNPSAQTTKVLVRELGHVPYRAILTGNPSPEGPLDFFSQFMFLHGTFLGFNNFWVFRKTMFQQGRVSWVWEPKPGVRDKIRTWVHDRAYFLSRKEAQVGGIELPPQRRRVEMNDRQITAYKEITSKFSFEYIETNFATVRDVWLARIAGGFSPDRENPELLSNAKTQAILDLMRGELAGEPVVIWFRFNEELAHVVEALNKIHVPTRGVTGAVHRAERKPIRAAWVRDEFQVLCVQVQLGKFGWDLSHASTMIYYSRPYELEANEQSRQRLVHPTKSDPYVVIDLITKGSLDEAIDAALRQKNRTSAAFRRAVSAQAWADLMKGSLHEKDTGRSQKEETAGRVTRVYPGGRTRHHR